MTRPMRRIAKNEGSESYFRLIAGPALKKFGSKIIQIWPESIYSNSAGYAVFLCEVEGEADDD